MIIRKPYAFLIKHFRKIHILLLVLCGYIYYKNLQVSSFVKEFMNLGTYDAYNEPISNYITGFANVALIILIIGSVTLAILLRYKKKPWKLYILPALEYLLMLIVFYATTAFFNSYTGELQSATIRAIRDFLFITTIIQYPTMAIFLMRILGVDLKKFNFKMDEEYLELENADREELEINIEFDKASIKRNIKRFIRNVNYIYLEHKFIVNSIIGVVTIILLISSYKYVFVTNKSYKEGETLSANGYTITINNSYYTDKDYTGNMISKKSSFVVLDLTITNTLQKREIDLNKFHIMNGISNFTTTAKTFETEFQDYGKAYEKKELKNNESFNLIMIFKVDKELSEKKYVLYYQEFNNNEPHLRKIKLNLDNVSEIKENAVIKLNEELKFTLKKKEETIIFDGYDFQNETDYSYRVCSSSTCKTTTTKYTAPTGYKILKISFASTEFEGKDMIDFSSRYGTIKYINNKGKTKSLEIKNPLNRIYTGKYLYVKVPEEVATSSSVELHFTIRNNKYIYKLK